MLTYLMLCHLSIGMFSSLQGDVVVFILLFIIFTTVNNIPSVYAHHTIR